MTTSRAGLDREKIVRAAAAIANERGLNELTMATLAAQLGVRAPTLYHYFPGLDGLRRAIALLGIDELSTRIGRAVMGQAGDDALLALSSAMWSFAEEEPGLYEATQRSPDPDDAEWLAAGKGVVDIMLRALSAYQLEPDDARQVVRMLRAILHGCVSLQHAGGFVQPGEVEATFHTLIEALLTHLHSRKP